MAPAVAVLTIEAQSMILAQRPVGDTSVMVVAVLFSGERLAYGGGRHGFGGISGGGEAVGRALGVELSRAEFEGNIVK
eukprot:scaffold112213_cov44-Cyclotella_meneghiniana.AAC.3